MAGVRGRRATVQTPIEFPTNFKSNCRGRLVVVKRVLTLGCHRPKEGTAEPTLGLGVSFDKIIR